MSVYISVYLLVCLYHILSLCFRTFYTTLKKIENVHPSYAGSGGQLYDSLEDLYSPDYVNQVRPGGFVFG